jgi:hypothetical protein
MKKWCVILCFLLIGSQVLGQDTIVTKKKKKFQGRVVERTQDGLVMRTIDGNRLVIPTNNISKIIRGNTVYDFEERVKYYLEVRRPFLPFVVLGIASGAYGIKKYQDYSNNRQKRQDALAGGGLPQDYQYLDDQSKRDLAWCIVSGLFSVGSFYVAFKPMEVKVPIGPIKIGFHPRGVTLALKF